MKKLLIIVLIFMSGQLMFPQYTTVDLGNTSANTTLFLHSGSNTPVPFNLRKTGYSGNSVSYGLLTLDMGHSTVGGGSNLHFRLLNSSGGYREYGGIGAYITDNTLGSEDGALTFYTTYQGAHRQRRMTLTAGGNLGIGTSNPGTWKLAVKGKIRAEEIKVETGWADYVFKEEYDLPTLEEVEKHIKEKGHLINIPSAKEVAKNGIQLGEMNKLLLEKIEELTLYVIELKKENESQQQEIEQLKTKNHERLHE